MVASLDSLRLTALRHYQILILLQIIDLAHGFTDLVQCVNGLATLGWTLVFN